jgi:phage tail-like protein
MGKQFPVNVTRFNPYGSYRFLVYFEGVNEPVAGVSKVGGLKRSSTPIEYKEGGNAITRKGIGRTAYEAITLERGVTHDPAFEAWANAAQVLDNSAPGQSLKNLRKKISIELCNEAGQPVLRYFVYACWVSEYQALPDLDAGGNAIALEHVKLENEGWERDLSLAEPTEK